MLHLLHSVTNVQETSLHESGYTESASKKPEGSHQLCTKKWVGHYTSFVAMFQTNNSTRNFSAMGPENAGEHNGRQR